MAIVPIQAIVMSYEKDDIIGFYLKDHTAGYRKDLSGAEVTLRRSDGR